MCTQLQLMKCSFSFFMCCCVFFLDLTAAALSCLSSLEIAVKKVIKVIRHLMPFFCLHLNLSLYVVVHINYLF